jgi:hypothetical protein
MHYLICRMPARENGRRKQRPIDAVAAVRGSARPGNQEPGRPEGLPHKAAIEQVGRFRENKDAEPTLSLSNVSSSWVGSRHRMTT